MSPPTDTTLKALILAGGRGTRLRPLTYAMAKQLVPVANKPILHYALDGLYRAGVRDFGIIISPETGESIKTSVADWQPPDAEITFIVQDEPAGLAHAVKTAKNYLGDDDFIMYLGDNLINADLAALIREFREKDCDASILLTEVDNPSSFGVAELDKNGNAVRLVEKPKDPQSNLALIGVYLFNHRVFEAIGKIKPSWRGELEITDAIQQLIDDSARVTSRIHTGWWLDTGKKDDLLAANRTVLGEYAVRDIAGEVDAESIVEKEVSLGTGSRVINSEIVGPVAIGDNCRIENATIGPFTSIGHGCVIANTNIENSVILEQCEISNLFGWVGNSLIGNHCKITEPPADLPAHQFLLADHSEIHVADGRVE